MKTKTITLQVGPESLRLLAELHGQITKGFKGNLTLTNIVQHLVLTGMHQARGEFKLSTKVPSSLLE